MTAATVALGLMAKPPRPGLAKTRLVETLGTVLGLNAHRIQFTPDLMPADILGAEVLETGAPIEPAAADRPVVPAGLALDQLGPGFGLVAGVGRGRHERFEHGGLVGR